MSSFINKKIIKSNNFKLSEITHHKILINEIKTINLKISICIHCYDINIFEELMYYINNFFEFKWKNIQIIIHYVNLNLKDIEFIIEKTMRKKLTLDLCNNFIFINGENIGVDIGGFLKCLNYVNNDDDLIVKIHTKSNDNWRRSMMNIFSVNGIYTSIMLLKNKKYGMIGSSYNIEHFRKKFNPQFNINQYYIPMIEYICNKINLPFDKINLIQSYFVAGTIFIGKKNIFNEIIDHIDFLYNLCLDLRKTKWISGKMKYTYEHALEIMFGYIPFHNKQYLIGLY